MMPARIRELLWSRRDIAALVVFRVLFGLLMAHDAFRYVWLGWVEDNYVSPQLSLGFVGFLWVQPLPAPALYGVFGLMIGCGITIAIGAYYRLSAMLFFLAHTYIFLIGAEFYLNHAYLISVVALLMVFVPAHRAGSVDVVRLPGLHSKQVHAWAYWLLLGTLSIVYVYGGIAKMNPDWFMGEPTRHWLHDRGATAWGPISELLRHEAATMFVCWGGLFFDLLIAPTLLWRRTRPIGVLLAVGFHLSNDYLFNIGVFPWFMIAATTLFFEPDWPRRLPELGHRIGELLDEIGASEDDHDALALAPGEANRTTALLASFFGLMLLLPLRHHLYPGNVAWNEEGHMFSWRMKLRNKQGHFSVRVEDQQTGQIWTVEPTTQLTARQNRKCVGRPDLLLQYIHYLRDAYRHQLGRDVAIYVDSFVSLNYRDKKRFIDPTVDLARVEHSLWHYSWVTEFDGSPAGVLVPPIDTSLFRTTMQIIREARLKSQRRPEGLSR